MKQINSSVNEWTGTDLLKHKTGTSLSISNGVSNRIVTDESADPQTTDTSSKKISEFSAPVPGCSRQTENRQDALQRWLEKTYSRLFFLSKNENSVFFTSFVSSLKNKGAQREASEKNTLEFLLALDDFFSNSAPLSLPAHFFIKQLLKKYRLLIDDYRASFVNLADLEALTDQSIKIEETEILNKKIENLEKEKVTLLEKQKALNVEHEILLRLTELTTDLTKLASERSRNFNNEIALNKQNLETSKKELAKISKEIKRESSFAEHQFEANIKIKSRNIRNLENELALIDEMLKKVEQFKSSNIIKEKNKLEEKEEKLLLKINNLDLKTIFMKQLESDSSGCLFSEKEEIKKDLQKNRLELDSIKTLMRMLANLRPIDAGHEINIFIEKINANLTLVAYKKNKEEEQEKINAQYRILKKNLAEIEKELGEAETQRSKEEISLESKLKECSITLLAQEKAKLEDEVSKLDEQLELNKALLDSILEEYDANQEELITFLDDKGSVLVKLIKQLLEKERKESSERAAELTKEKEELELLDKKNKLNARKRELEEQLCKIEKDEKVWNMIADSKIGQILGYLEKLQAISDQTEETVDQLEKKLAELKEKFTKLLKDSGKDINKCEKAINKCETALKKHKEARQVQEAAEKDYREQMNRIINEKKEHNQFELQQNEKSLESNLCDIRGLTVQIEWRKAKEGVKEAEDLLLRTVVESLEDNNTTAQPENIFFNTFTAVLRELKEQVDSAEWNTHGWGFFCKKVPDGIQRIRLLLNKIFNDLSLDGGNLHYYEQNLFMLSQFLDIYHLITQKNSYKKCLRSSGVKRFYQSVEQSLKPLYEELNATIDPGWFRVLVDPTITNNKTFDLLSSNLFKEELLKLSDDRIQFSPTSSCSSC